jgi:hypothetical protein
MKKLLLFVSIFLLAILFTGCVTILSSDTTVKLDESEKWEINQEILFEGESFKEYGQTVTDGLNSLVTEGKTSGVDITFKEQPARGGNIPYTITIKGEGIDKLNQMLGSTENGTPAFNKVTVNGESAYGFQMDATSMSSGGLDLGLSPEFTFTIEGMNVLETNGKKSGNSVTWKNPTTTMTAALAPASSSGGGMAWWLILLIVVGVAAIALVILLVLGVFKKKQPQPQYYYPGGYGTPAPPPPAPAVMPYAAPPMPPSAPVMTPPSPQAYQPVMPPQPAQPPYQPVVHSPQPVPLAPQAPLPPPSSGSMQTIIAPRKAAQEESTGEATIMVQHVAPTPPAAPKEPSKPPTEEPKP